MHILYGKHALDPAAVAALCHKYPQDEVYCLPWVTTDEELEKNLRVNLGRPNRVVPCELNTKEEDIEESVDFDEKLNQDAFGRMADLLKQGVAVVNEVMTTSFPSDFYGNVMMRGPGAQRYIVSAKDMNKYFPQVPLSAKLYAATTTFVEMEGTDEFATFSGSKVVDVMFATPFFPGSQELLGFLKLMTGIGILASFRPRETFPRKNVALFRYNKGYRLQPWEYMKMFARNDVE